MRRRPAPGRRPKLDDAQVEQVRAALELGAQAHGFEADLWTLERVGVVVERVTGVSLSRVVVSGNGLASADWPARLESATS